MPITPDTKNWTWVLERPCPECGFDPAAVRFRDVPRLTRDAIAVWREVLARPASPSDRTTARGRRSNTARTPATCCASCTRDST